MTNEKKETIKKNDFIELKYTGVSDGKIFDSNIEEDLKKIDSKAKAQKTVIVVGQGMIVPGIDKFVEGKDVGKEYSVKISAKEGFGERNRELIKTIPLKIFTEKKISPYAGLVLSMDNALAKVLTISGARVVTDFNNPLAGKELEYKFTVVRIITDEKEKVENLFELLIKKAPPFEIKEKTVEVSGPKEFEFFVKAFNDKFKEIIGKELAFKLEEKKESKKVETKKEEKKTEQKINEVKKEDAKV